MRIPRPIKNLVEALERLPGIGPKTAQRLTFYLLHVPQEELDMLSSSVSKLKSDTKVCSICRNVGEADPCEICSDYSRDTSKIAVVETLLDVLALERAGFKGLYHVLHGAINPLNNIGPEELFIKDLINRLLENTRTGEPDGSNLKKSASGKLDFPSLAPVLHRRAVGFKEIILATNTNMEGEATAMYIREEIRNSKHEIRNIKVTRIARGLPIGGDLEYADQSTLGKALEGRTEY